MNKKLIIGLGIFAAISIAVIITNFLIAFREKTKFSPASPQANTTAIREEVFSEDNTADFPREDDEPGEESLNGQPFLLN